MKQILILQLRKNDKVSEEEFQALLAYGGISRKDTHRVRMEREEIPSIHLKDYCAVFVGGGPWNVSDAPEKKSQQQKRAEAKLYPLLAEIVKRDFPYFGACFGLGILAKHMGAKVSKEKYAESAEALTIIIRDAAQNDPLLAGLPPTFRAFAGHKESCQEPIPGAAWLAGSGICPYHMFRAKQNVYATQFHPELDVEGICSRIDIYKHDGYFPPEDAQKLQASARKETVTVPMRIWKRFVKKYQK